MTERILNSTEDFKKDTFQLLRGLITENLCTVEGDDKIFEFFEKHNVPVEVHRAIIDSRWELP